MVKKKIEEKVEAIHGSTLSAAEEVKALYDWVAKNIAWYEHEEKPMLVIAIIENRAYHRMYGEIEVD